MILNNIELQHIEGGKISAALLNAIIKGYNTIMDAGRSLGSAIRRIHTRSLCGIN